MSDSIPRGLRVATAYSWRFLVVGGVLAVVVWLVIQLKLLVIPLLVAILLGALLCRRPAGCCATACPKWLAIVVALLGALASSAGLLWLVVSQVARGCRRPRRPHVVAFDQFRQYLIDGPLQLTEEQIDDFLAQAVASVQQDSELLLSGALAIGTTLGHVARRRAARALHPAVHPRRRRRHLALDVRPLPAPGAAGRRRRRPAGWVTVINYARGSCSSRRSTRSASGSARSCSGCRSRSRSPCSSSSASFVPIVGAVVTGALAVFLALVYNGPWIALWMLVVVLGVQQLEGHVLQPLLMGSAVKVHPLAVVLVVAGGALIAGIPGALFAVPLAAVRQRRRRVHLPSASWETATPDRRHGDLIWSTVPRPRRTPA